MATQQRYSYLANALVGYAHQWIATLPGYEQSFIPMDKIPAAAGALAKFCVDTDDQYLAHHPAATEEAAAKMLADLRKLYEPKKTGA